MTRIPNRRTTRLVLFALLITCPAMVGCVGIAAQLLHIGLGNMVDPKYEGLAEQRVAVVCVSQSSLFGPTTAAVEIAEQIERNLKSAMPTIQIINQQQINAWTDEHDWNQIDFRELGQGVGAQKLVAVELNSFSLYEGKTLFKGRADVELTVYDLTRPSNEPVFEDVPAQIQYPITTGQYTADTTEETFRRRFIGVIAKRIARNFYAYDVAEDFGEDSTALGF